MRIPSARTRRIAIIGLVVESLVACGAGSPAELPAAPTGLVAVGGDTAITLTWNAVSGAAWYNLYWATASGVGKGIGSRLANASSPYLHGNLTNGTTYYYAVTAVNGAGEGDASAEAHAQPRSAAPTLWVTLGSVSQGEGLALDWGGDRDTAVVAAGTPPQAARASGNGQALPSPSGNTVPDYYLQFKVDNASMFAGHPTPHVRIEVDYLDQGTDTFTLQYDAQPSSGTDGRFASGGTVFKTQTGTFQTAVFELCDAYFADRDNGADFRLFDNGDGAEIVREVRVIELPAGGSRTIQVDDFGASPWDDQPDSAAIQAALDSTCSGDTVVFTSGVGSSGYLGYRIDRTLFLTGLSAKHLLTFTASDPGNHALLRATRDLKGFVVRLYARSRVQDAGSIDDIDFGYIDVDGARGERTCVGPDGLHDGIGDNWGSWLPECSVAGDSWCVAGNIAMQGADGGDPAQDYAAHPSLWTTGLSVHDLVDRDAECGTALVFAGAQGVIRGVTIDTAGDHVHANGCARTDDDGDPASWADGITLGGPAHSVTGNTVIDPSDIGIVHFGGRDTVISGNTIRIRPGNRGAFGGIALHPWVYGDASGTRVVGNTVISEGDSTCGGLHVGINLGPHMWGGACLQASWAGAVGNATCALDPVPPAGAPCSGGPCQVWTWIPAGSSVVMQDNVVTGAHVNYLVEGVDALGQLAESNNASQAPRTSDWEASRSGCFGATWGPIDKVAHHPSLPGWTDLRIHCER